MNERMNVKDECCCGFVEDAIESIALEEAAISHILNAEGEKIQKAVATATTIDELIRVNCSVQNTIIDITNLEMVLFNKLRLLVKADCECEPCPKKRQRFVVPVCTRMLFKGTALQCLCESMR